MVISKYYEDSVVVLFNKMLLTLSSLNLEEEVGELILGYEIFSLLDRNFALAYRPSVSKKKRKERLYLV